ncbi:MAG: hypothetical protein K8T91_18235 [Planctomycetes bacterium]|nr:hypothetical protein [Planctomycetota bacterium]
MVSRFSPEDFDKQTDLARKMMDNASSLKLHLHKSEDGKCYMDFELEGSFGDKENEDGFPKVDHDEAQDNARQLLAAFLGE